MKAYNLTIDIILEFNHSDAQKAFIHINTHEMEEDPNSPEYRIIKIVEGDHGYHCGDWFIPFSTIGHSSDNLH